MKYPLASRLAVVSAVLPVVFATGCASTTHRSSVGAAQVQKHIDAGNATWIQAMRYQDPQLLASVFDADGVLLAADGDIYRGRDAIADAMGRVMQSWGPTETTIDTDELWILDDIAVERGRYTYTYKNASGADTIRRGRYVVRWMRQDDGAWKIESDLGLPDN